MLVKRSRDMSCCTDHFRKLPYSPQVVAALESGTNHVICLTRSTAHGSGHLAKQIGSSAGALSILDADQPLRLRFGLNRCK